MNVETSVQLLVLVVLSATLMSAVRTNMLTNRLLQAQVIKDRFDMYFTTYRGVSTEDIQSVRDFPEDWVDLDVYRSHYANNEQALRKYLTISRIYEYLTYLEKLHRLGFLAESDWKDEKRWIQELKGDPTFRHVHHYYRAHYADFAKLVEGLVSIE